MLETPKYLKQKIKNLKIKKIKERKKIKNLKIKKIKERKR